MQRDLSERLMRYVFMFCALISIIAILLIFYFIFVDKTTKLLYYWLV